ncbi:hypothetical protein GOP47_0018357 [Adiantum capillus-veneris]|uniref:Pentatricopeptide repeat-containing protein n=1 Tax=Adiantum capillus-veneris TaxID=13818 RepID=A0A9D4UI15_ADICA|nr:hypothetical protein GOP47_0018357 [Adiantum capillus-veneris]
MQLQLFDGRLPVLGQQREHTDFSRLQAPQNDGKATAEFTQVSRRAKTGGTHSLESPNVSSHIDIQEERKEAAAELAIHKPIAASVGALLKGCGREKDLQKGIEIHNSFTKSGLFQSNSFAGNSLINMYAKCGALAKAQDAFDGLLSRNIVSWNVLIAGYAQNECSEKALTCYEEMQKEGFSPNAFTFSCILKACANLRNAKKGREVHSHIVRERLLDKDIVVANALIDMYFKCGALETAQQVFDEIPNRDIVSWNVLITGYAQHGKGEKALMCYDCMLQVGFSPTPVTLVCLLKACSSSGALDKGKEIHEEILKLHLLEKNILVANALVDMYAKCGELKQAQEVFDELPLLDVITWNGLISGYVEQGYGEEALRCYNQMQHWGFFPDGITILCILKACANIAAIDMGHTLHAHILRYGFLEKDIQIGSALIDMYTKCSALERAKLVFEDLSILDIVTWNVLIAGYADNGYCEDAFDCFEHMQQSGFSPSAASFSCILKAIGSTGIVHRGQAVHAVIVRQGVSENDTIVGTALVDMYANCGMLVEAQDVFDKLSMPNVVSWSALMVGLAQLGKKDAVFRVFHNMIGDGMEPNSVTFMVMLNMCSHEGLLFEGQMFFDLATNGYGIIPSAEYYTCMIDLFGRAGLLQEAVAIAQEISSCGNLTMWHTLLGACQKWGYVKLGRWAFDQVVRLDEGDDANYVSMRNIYAAAGRQEDANMIEAMRVKKQASKKPGEGWWNDEWDFPFIHSYQR